MIYPFRPARSTAVVFVLRPLDALEHDRLHDVGRSVDEKLQLLAFRAAEVGQHVVGRILPARRTPDPEPDSRVLLARQRLRHRTQPVVAALTAAPLDPYLPEW